MTNLDMSAAGNTEPLGELNCGLHCAGEYETALDDADTAIAALDGTVQSDDTLLVKAHYRRVRSKPTVARLRQSHASCDSACLCMLQIAAIIGLGRDKDLAAAVRKGTAAFSRPEPVQRLRSALASDTSPLTAAWLAKVPSCHHELLCRLDYLPAAMEDAAYECKGRFADKHA